MRKFAIALTLTTLLAGTVPMTGAAMAADLPQSFKSVGNPLKDFDRMPKSDDVPTVAELITANKIDGTLDDPTAMSDQFYVNGDSQGDGAFSLEVQKRLLEF